MIRCRPFTAGSVRSELKERADGNHLGIVQFVDVDFFIPGAHADAEHAEPGADPLHGGATVETGLYAADVLLQVVFHAAEAASEDPEVKRLVIGLEDTE
ncbi:MAG: hypothetical protein ACREVT_06870 [Burkholderiales bacterium]